jgi:hypothetical protein
MDSRVTTAEAALETACANLEAARARSREARADKHQRTKDLARSDGSRLRAAWKDACEALEFAEAQVSAGESAEQAALAELNAARHEQAEAAHAARAAVVSDGVKRIVALEKTIGEHLATIEQLRFEQQRILVETIQPNQSPWTRTNHFQRCPEGIYESVAAILKKHGDTSEPSMGSVYDKVQAAFR